MTTATEPTIVPPVTMLENLMSSLADVMGNEDPQVLQSGIQDVIDEAARYQAMLTGTDQGRDLNQFMSHPIRTGSGVAQGSGGSAASIEAVLTMLAETNTKTGAILSILKKAGLLDDVARGVNLPVRGVVKAVKGIRAKRKVAVVRRPKATAKLKKAARRR